MVTERKPGILEAVGLVKRQVEDRPCPECKRASRFIEDAKAAGKKLAVFMCWNESWAGIRTFRRGEGDIEIQKTPCHQRFFAVFEDGTSCAPAELANYRYDGPEVPAADGVKLLVEYIEETERRRLERERQSERAVSNLTMCVNDACAARGFRMIDPFCVHCGTKTGKGKPLFSLRCGNEQCGLSRITTNIPPGGFCRRCGTKLVDGETVKKQKARLEAKG